MKMRILADENVDRPIVTWLREQGHDVEEAAVVARSARDIELVERSRETVRVLLTFDRDVGRLLRGDLRPHPGVVDLCLRGAGPDVWSAFKMIWPEVEPGAAEHFTTVRNHQVRRRPLPM